MLERRLRCFLRSIAESSFGVGERLRSIMGVVIEMEARWMGLGGGCGGVVSGGALISGAGMVFGSGVRSGACVTSCSGLMSSTGIVSNGGVISSAGIAFVAGVVFGDGVGSSCGEGGYMASMALIANAVVRPRFPIMMPEVPNLYIQPVSQPPSSHCRGSSFRKSTSFVIPTYLHVRMRIERVRASPPPPTSSCTRSFNNGSMS
jgi:hypothetical protein